jgi:hypothetical protein
MRRAGHVRVQVRLVRRELHDARLRDDVRQRRQLHGSRRVFLPFALDGSGLPKAQLRAVMQERGAVHRPRHVPVPATMERPRL